MASRLLLTLLAFSASVYASTIHHDNHHHALARRVLLGRDQPAPAQLRRRRVQRRACISPSPNVPPINNNPPPSPPPVHIPPVYVPSPPSPPSPPSGGETFAGDATWFNVGLGACGHMSYDNEFIAAAAAPLFEGFEGYPLGANPNNNPICGRRARVYYQDKSVDVTMMDECPPCARGSLDLSPAAFQQLAHLDVGRMQMTWHFI